MKHDLTLSTYSCEICGDEVIHDVMKVPDGWARLRVPNRYRDNELVEKCVCDDCSNRIVNMVESRATSPQNISVEHSPK